MQNPTHFAVLLIAGFLSRPGFNAAFGSLMKAGIPLAIGSDGPLNPYLNILMVSTLPHLPAEAITREQAVIANTRTAAFAEFEESNKGTLTVGKWADLAVLPQNIFKVTNPRLLQTESVLTMVGGKIVYDAGVLNTGPSRSKK
ncbi:amidohydrolase family protein [Larkinella soli]|uniref:amidohydrolase family protein n=1 Tax=Larkinella soli TaxID=1770527 RepID=UPI000FFBC1F7|nr:amidohydrolase family protein [Larkinella soli]